MDDKAIAALPFAAFLFVGMLLCLELGRRIGTRRLANTPSLSTSGLGVLESAVFGLYGLLVAFTFSVAPSKLDARKQLIVEEANAIGTAYLRLDLLPSDAQPALREQFRSYLDSRIDTYRKLPDVAAAKSELAKSSTLQQGIWNSAVAASRSPEGHSDAAKLLLPAINEMIDITSTRTMAALIHPPPMIFWLLLSLALVCSVLAGHSMAINRQHSWLHMITFAVATVLTVFVILEIEYPRTGYFRMDKYDQPLVDLRQSMQ